MCSELWNVKLSIKKLFIKLFFWVKIINWRSVNRNWPRGITLYFRDSRSYLWWVPLLLCAARYYHMSTRQLSVSGHGNLSSCVHYWLNIVNANLTADLCIRSPTFLFRVSTYPRPAVTTTCCDPVWHLSSDLFVKEWTVRTNIVYCTVVWQWQTTK